MEMMQSSLYSFDEPSVWDPKVIREYLHIPEDQLKILSNIPGWSKDKDSSNVSRATSDIILDSQSSQKQTSTTVLHSNQKEQNIKVFEKHLQNYKINLENIQIYKKNFTRSVSLSDLDKFIDNSSCNKSLSRVLSAPFLSGSYFNSCSAPVLEGSKSVNSAIVCSREELSLPKSSQNCLFAEQQKSNFQKENLVNMEVISQLPATIYLENKTNSDVVEKTLVPAIHTPDNAVNSDLPATIYLENIKNSDAVEKTLVPAIHTTEIVVNSELPATIYLENITNRDIVDKTSIPVTHTTEIVFNSELPATIYLENITNSDVVEKTLVPAIHTPDSLVTAATLSNMSANNSLPIVPQKECILAKPKNSETSENIVDSCNVKDTLCVDKISTVTEKEKNDKGDLKLMNTSEASSDVLKPLKLIQKKLESMVGILDSCNKVENSNLQDAGKNVIECIKEPHLEAGGLNANTASLESVKEIHNAVVKISVETSTSEKESVREVMECDKEPLEKSSSSAMNITSAEKLVQKTESNAKVDTAFIKTTTEEKAIAEKMSCEIPGNTVAHSTVAHSVMVASSDVEKVEKKSIEMPVKVTNEKAVAEKRKLEYKEKTNKKRKSNAEKQVQSGKRSIKRAGEIYYSDSDFRSLINILKRFF